MSDDVPYESADWANASWDKPTPPSGLFHPGDRVGLKQSLESWNISDGTGGEVPAGAKFVLHELLNAKDHVWTAEAERADLRRQFGDLQALPESLMQLLGHP